MSTDTHRFSDIRGIVEAIEASNGSPSLGFSPPLASGFEQKYAIGPERVPIPHRELTFQKKIYDLLKRGQIKIEARQVFAGADEYFIFDGNGRTGLVRLRWGSNRPCQLTTKVQVEGGKNVERQQSDVSFAFKDRAKMRTLFVQIGKTVKRCRHFIVGQSGEFWFVSGKDGHRVEIVLYKAGRGELEATSKLRLFAEIAPRGCPNAKVASQIITSYEHMLELEGCQIKKTLAEIFGPP